MIGRHLLDSAVEIRTRGAKERFGLSKPLVNRVLIGQ